MRPWLHLIILLPTFLLGLPAAYAQVARGGLSPFDGVSIRKLIANHPDTNEHFPTQLTIEQKQSYVLESTQTDQEVTLLGVHKEVFESSRVSVRISAKVDGRTVEFDLPVGDVEFELKMQIADEIIEMFRIYDRFSILADGNPGANSEENLNQNPARALLRDEKKELRTTTQLRSQRSNRQGTVRLLLSSRTRPFSTLLPRRFSLLPSQLAFYDVISSGRPNPKEGVFGSVFDQAISWTLFRQPAEHAELAARASIGSGPLSCGGGE